MTFRYIDMDSFPRKAHFDYFSGLENPYVGITAEVDITGFPEVCKEKGYPFFLTFLYCAANAANAVPELRQRIRDGKIVEYDYCIPSHTVLHDNGTYSYCRLSCDMPLEEFLPKATAAQAYIKEHPTLDDGADALGLIFVSSLPWISYSAMVQPTPRPADSNLRLTWGKYFTREGKTLIPVTILANHALVDGIHIARFYQILDEKLKQI